MKRMSDKDIEDMLAEVDKFGIGTTSAGRTGRISVELLLRLNEKNQRVIDLEEKHGKV
jgi:hypothetical protein